MTLKEKANDLKSVLPAVYLALKDRETPLPAKLLAAVTVCYALSPIDLVPDFIPVLGYLDDLLILPALIGLTAKLIPKPVLQRSLELSRRLWENGTPKKWYFAIPVLLIWGLLLAAVIHALRRG